jgi:hypothetical protein
VQEAIAKPGGRIRGREFYSDFVIGVEQSSARLHDDERQ